MNDRLWGESYTDWDSLREAPERNREGNLILGPTSTFGYYDLRNTTIRKMQATLAKGYGVDGFVYHHDWLYDVKHPGPSLHAPITDMLQDGEPNFSFCLHWVAENWTTTWHRSHAEENQTDTTIQDETQDLLQRQYFPSQSSDPAIQVHYEWLRQFVHHEKYIKVQGTPLLMLYRAAPGVQLVIARLKELAIQDGFPGLFCTLGQYVTNDDIFPRGRNK